MDTVTLGSLEDTTTSTDYVFDDYFWLGWNYTNVTNSSWRLGDPEEGAGDERADLWREIPLGIVLTFLCLLTTVGNILVLHAVRTEKRLQSVSNMFIVSLAVADLIVGMTVMPISTFYIFAGHWPFGVAVCQIWIGIDYTASTASILNLFILSLDRYWSVRAPLQYLHKRTRRRALSMISLVWVVSSLWVIPIAGWHYFAHGGVRTVPPDVCDTEYAKDSVFKVVTAFFNFYLPLTIMYILYIRVFIEIRKRSVFELGQRNPGRRRLSFHVKANPANCRSQDDDDSGRDDDTFTDDRSSRERGINLQETSISSLQRLQRCGVSSDSLNRVRENGSRGKQTSFVASNCNAKQSSFVSMNCSNAAPNGRNLRLLAMRRQFGTREEPSPSSPSVSLPRKMYKVEYVYDENVMDPQTEKLERYYYEEQPDRRCLQLTRYGDRTRTLRHSASVEKGLVVSGCSGPQSDQKIFGPTSARAGPLTDQLGPTLDRGNSKEEKKSGSSSRGTVHFFRTLQGKKSRSITSSKFRSYGTAPTRSKKKSDGTPTLTRFSLSCDILPSPSRDSCVAGSYSATETSGIEMSCRPEASSSSSSSSTFDDSRRGRTDRADENHSHSRRCHRSNHSPSDYSLVSGLRRMRLADNFVDQAMISGGGRSIEGGVDSDDLGNSNNQGEIFVLRDDKNRRLTGTMLNLRHRIIKNFRVSSTSSLKKEIKAARQLGVIMGAFTLCFLPYFILFLVVAFCDDCIEPGLLTAATWVGYLNSTLNPFLYPLCNAAFRRKFRTMLRFRSSSSSSNRYNYYERNSMTRARYD